jgi:integrase
MSAPNSEANAHTADAASEGGSMAAKMERTSTPGIFRRGSRYIATWRDEQGKLRKKSAATMRDAKRIKASRETDVDRGEALADSRVRFGEYAIEWVNRYQGRGTNGFRAKTRDDYRRWLELYACPFFDGRLKRTVAAVTPRDIANFVGWLCDERAMVELAHSRAVDRARRNGKKSPKPLAPDARHRLSDSTVRNVLNPVRACFATAVAEGVVRHNPTAGIALPHRPNVDSDEGDVRPLTRDQLRMFLNVVHPRHRLLFELLASTGLRIGEAVGLQWKHLRLDGSTPHVQVRRSVTKGRVEPPKTRHGRRDVPLHPTLVSALRQRRMDAERPEPDALVFPSRADTFIHVENLRNRVLNPALEEVGAAWAVLHTFRHTCASILFERGANVVRVSRWLGHGSPAFTLSVYVHLMQDDLGEPLSLADELRVGTPVGTEPPEAGRVEIPALTLPAAL